MDVESARLASEVMDMVVVFRLQHPDARTGADLLEQAVLDLVD